MSRRLKVSKKNKFQGENRREMGMPWCMTLWMARMVWMALRGWVASCLTVADEVASSLRTGDMGPFHVG